jgi:trehalose 6-phosphate synthase/phosphatase
MAHKSQDISVLLHGSQIADVYSPAVAILRSNHRRPPQSRYARPATRMRTWTNSIPIGYMAVKLINVSNRLPVTVNEEEITKSSGGLVAALEGLSESEYQIQWIGWPGAAFADEQRREEIGRILPEEYGCIPVFLEDQDVHDYYEGFANSSIWPLLHYLPNFLHYESKWWKSYQRVNRLFADKVLEFAKGDDLVWVHDYQLMLLPAMLREACPGLKIGFFLHTPFPPFDIFRCHPNRRELLAGVLGADRVGFHTFAYLRHFSGCVNRLLDVESAFTRVRMRGRSVGLGIYPIGVNAARFDQTLESDGFKERLEEIRKIHAGKRLIVSVERMDYTKGILRRLEAIDLFLAECKIPDDIRFVFVSVPSREGIEEYQDLRGEVEARIGRINGKYATINNNPIHFIHASVPFVDLCALYALADVAIVTPLIDGMNLVAKEYVACQKENAGSLILSEFAGAAEELFNAFQVNPYDAQAVARTLETALSLGPEEKQSRNLPMRERVIRYDARHWARSFISDLASSPSLESAPGEDKLSEIQDAIRKSIQSGDRTLLFVDYDGTLREIVQDPKAAIPTDEIHELLARLNQIVDLTVISGRSEADLELFFGRGPFRLIAEHGAAIRRPGTGKWDRLDRAINYDWMKELIVVLRTYEEGTPGSFIEEKRSSIVWHYRKAEHEFGEWRARQLAEELGFLTANHPVRVQRGKKMVEVSSSRVHKGAAVEKVVDEIGRYGMILCAGDDRTDETMFELGLPRLISIKVGEGTTQAQHRIADPADFRQFLRTLLEQP